MSQKTRKDREQKAGPKDLPPSGRAEKRALQKSGVNRLYSQLEMKKDEAWRKHAVELTNAKNLFQYVLIKVRYLFRQRDAAEVAQERLRLLAQKHRLPLDIPGKRKKSSWFSRVVNRISERLQEKTLLRALKNKLGRS